LRRTTIEEAFASQIVRKSRFPNGSRNVGQVIRRVAAPGGADGAQTYAAFGFSSTLIHPGSRLSKASASITAHRLDLRERFRRIDRPRSNQAEWGRVVGRRLQSPILTAMVRVHRLADREHAVEPSASGRSDHVTQLSVLVAPSMTIAPDRPTQSI